MDKKKNEKLTLEAISDLIDKKLDQKFDEKLSLIYQKLDKIDETLEKHDKQFEKVFDILERNNLK
ncbi:MAG: hypothetical protein ACRDA7_01235 [Metamycoplasmataceae bacterium]